MTQSAGNQPQQPARPADLTAPQKAGLSAGARPAVAPTGSTKTLPAKAGAAPTLRPQSAGSGGGAGTKWLSSVHITAVWSINQDRNAWVYVDTTGWVKLSNASDSGIVTLTLLATLARLTGEAVSCRQESDGMVHEIYA
jgi:hypothetical protein